MSYKTTINAPDYPPKLKHKVIIEAFEALAPTESMLLINDHDPVPLRYQFEAVYPASFTWEYLEEGPDVYQVVISKK